MSIYFTCGFIIDFVFKNNNFGILYLALRRDHGVGSVSIIILDTIRLCDKS